MYCVRWSNEAATVHADITADHRDVPAFLCLRWEEAQPKNLQVDFPFSKRVKLRPNHSVSFQCLYGFRNLIYCRLRQLEQLHLART